MKLLATALGLSDEFIFDITDLFAEPTSEWIIRDLGAGVLHFSSNVFGVAGLSNNLNVKIESN